MMLLSTIGMTHHASFSGSRFLGVVVLGDRDVPLEFYDRGCDVHYDPKNCIKSKRRSFDATFPHGIFLGGGYGADRKTIEVYVCDKTNNSILSVPIWRLYAKQPGATIHSTPREKLAELVDAVSRPKALAEVKVKVEKEKEDKAAQQQKYDILSIREEVNLLRNDQISTTTAMKTLKKRVTTLENEMKSKKEPNTRSKKNNTVAETKAEKEMRALVERLEENVKVLTKRVESVELENISLKRTIDFSFSPTPSMFSAAQHSEQPVIATKKIKKEIPGEDARAGCTKPHQDTFYCGQTCMYLKNL